MSAYHLQQEKYYWLKLIFDGFLLLCAFLTAYFIKRGHLDIEGNFQKFLPLLISIWFVTTLFSKKFMIAEKQQYFETLKPFIFSGLALTAALTFLLYLFGMYYLSRLIIYGSIGIFLILEIVFLSCQFFFFSKRNKIKSENPFFISFFLIEFIFIISTFVFIYLYRKGTIKLRDDYQLLLMGIFSIWLLVSLLSHKFNIVKAENYLKTIFPFLRSEVIMISIISFFIFLFNLATYSRTIILGSLALFSILEIAIVSIYYVYTKPQVTDEHDINFLQTSLIEEKETKEIREETKEKPTIYSFSGFPVKTISIKEKLKNVYLSKFPSIYEFIRNHLKLDKIDIFKAEVFNTNAAYNIEILEDNSFAFLLNLHKVNDFRRINQYFIEINKKLTSGGVFISNFESIEQRKRRVYQKYPYIFAKLFYIFDFIYKRAWPKLPFFKKIYFTISGGKNRILSIAECLGRLYFCGFQLITLGEIDNLHYFIVKKIKKPLKDKNPSYGFIFKQKRVSKDLKIINAYKVRTMYPYSEYIHKLVYEKNKLDERGKISKDFRITNWGQVFRKYYIDELPMLINFIKGELKLFGVRALSKTFYNTYPEDLKKERTKYKPGLVPPYYVDLPSSIEEVWESERKYLKKYAKHPFWTDFVYFIKVLKNILFHHAKSA